jgi:hypothetical protein
MRLSAKERDPWKNRIQVESVLNFLEYLEEEEFRYA